MLDSSPRAGYTLPVFACAAAIAALRHLHQDSLPKVSVDLLEPAEIVDIAIEQVACLNANSALAITRSDPGDNLDLTRNTPIWAFVERIENAEHGDTKTRRLGDEAPTKLPILLKGGEGIGKQINADNQPAIYAYARRLLLENLSRWLQPGEQIEVTIVLPAGRALAKRTSNAAFGVVEGLSLLGTSGIAQPLSAPGQLEVFRQVLQQKAGLYEALVFCVGENGLDLAKQLGIPSDRLIKTANWLGSMLVEAGIQGVQSILLFGYHGKLIKLAGGIFHTHHHVADGRQEILAAHCASLGLSPPDVQVILASPTTEAALKYLRELDSQRESHWVEPVYRTIAQHIDQRAAAYIQTHSDRSVAVGSVLFDRDRQIIVQSQTGTSLLSKLQTLGE
ncbi:MAG: cobalt-precorrin-5B (C(1))-methyltransferase [Cyanobacteria bacterium CRU_2_1]|nr:cobalt-precorrin-5B (C(1))-methyltransferase [Cyanobacteria bacterium CRU_2_1]